METNIEKNLSAVLVTKTDTKPKKKTVSNSVCFPLKVVLLWPPAKGETEPNRTALKLKLDCFDVR